MIPGRTFALCLTMLLPRLACAQGAPAGAVGWYTGDCQSGIPGMSNWYLSAQQFSRVYDQFVVPAGGWTIAGVFSHNNMSIEGVTEAIWEIRSGVSNGNGGAIVAAGLSPAAQLYLLSWPDGSRIYRAEVDGLRVQLGPGTYWLSVTPIADFSQSYVCSSAGVSATGTTSAVSGRSFVYAVGPHGRYNFTPLESSGQAGSTSDFSQGVILAAGAAAPAPSIAAVVNAASWKSGAIAPGEIVTIGGTGLGPYTAASLTLDEFGAATTALDGVQVLFNNVLAPESYVSAEQINAVLPYGLPVSGSASVQVVMAGQKSNAMTIPLAAAVPALFTSDGSGSGHGAILNGDASYNSSARPAAKGSTVVLYLTGEGLTKPAGATGAVTTVAATDPITPQPVLPVAVMIGGQPASIVFVGEAPGLISGVLQLNVKIPASVASGEQPVVVSIGETSSPAGVTVSVQ